MPLMLAANNLPECAATSHANALKSPGTRKAPSFPCMMFEVHHQSVLDGIWCTGNHSSTQNDSHE